MTPSTVLLLIDGVGNKAVGMGGRMTSHLGQPLLLFCLGP